MTTSDFSAGARQEAARADATPVALMNGTELVALLLEHQIGDRRRPLELWSCLRRKNRSSRMTHGALADQIRQQVLDAYVAPARRR